MIIKIVLWLIIIIPLTVVWVGSIDKAIDDEAWKRQREKDRQEEDKAQEEYLRYYNQKKQIKKYKKERKNANKKERKK